MIADVAVVALLALGAASVLLSSAGLLRFRSVHDRLHYASPAALVGGWAIALAIAIELGISASTAKAILAAALLAGTSPVLAHATGRAARIRAGADWRPGLEERTKEPRR